MSQPILVSLVPLWISFQWMTVPITNLQSSRDVIYRGRDEVELWSNDFHRIFPYRNRLRLQPHTPGDEDSWDLELKSDFLQLSPQDLRISVRILGGCRFFSILVQVEPVPSEDGEAIAEQVKARLFFLGGISNRCSSKWVSAKRHDPYLSQLRFRLRNSWNMLFDQKRHTRCWHARRDV